ncbi:MAG: hypothetical protein Q8R61_13085 [Thiobacillus sp.]|uniref:hypothetical protein n=1 Tax=Thiobacillus sp. TaxID=924 RepID=UPI002733D89F|nr:hypothetical protein [Thiobacillus sp.]MDP3586058.1 hypothetical protein [Thiobacillus sp.]
MTIEQIVASAGNGQLKDESVCSKELRSFLGQVPSTKLAEYANHCLTDSYPKSGFVLQDIVNELGRRLGYEVTNGRYQGTTNSIGNDGLWRSPNGHDLLVEVKTSDAYRISLDKIAAYRDEQLKVGGISKSNSMLIVVGRDDTGELEAQVRGSRHAWDMRLISVDALLRLADLMEQTENVDTADKIRSLLVPLEYTRLDTLIDVMFTTAKDVVETVDEAPSANNGESKSKNSYDFTDAKVLDLKRERIVASVSKANGNKLIRKSRVLYWDDTHTFRVACAVSKRYLDSNTPYWYAYHPPWDAFIAEGGKGFFVLGCMDLDVAFVIPVDVMRQHLDELQTTNKPDGKMYWHIKILEPEAGKYLLQMPKSGKHLSLEEFTISV